MPLSAFKITLEEGSCIRVWRSIVWHAAQGRDCMAVVTEQPSVGNAITQMNGNYLLCNPIPSCNYYTAGRSNSTINQKLIRPRNLLRAISLGYQDVSRRQKILEVKSCSADSVLSVALMSAAGSPEAQVLLLHCFLQLHQQPPALDAGISATSLPGMS